MVSDSPSSDPPFPDERDEYHDDHEIDHGGHA